MQLHRCFMSQSSEFCRHNPLCCFSTTVYCCKRTFRYDSVRKLLDTPSYRLDLARNGFPCTGIYPLNGNILNHVDFLFSHVTEITKPADIETACSEGQASDIRTQSTSSEQLTAEHLKKTSSLPDSSRHRITLRRGSSAVSEIPITSPLESDLDRKRGSTTERPSRKTANKQKDVRINCTWKEKPRLRQKRCPNGSFVESHSVSLL
jgi:hypothetical protein